METSVHSDAGTDVAGTFNSHDALDAACAGVHPVVDHAVGVATAIVGIPYAAAFSAAAKLHGGARMNAGARSNARITWRMIRHGFMRGLTASLKDERIMADVQVFVFGPQRWETK